MRGATIASIESRRGGAALSGRGMICRVISLVASLAIGCGVAASQQLAPSPQTPPQQTLDMLAVCPLITPELQKVAASEGTHGRCPTRCLGCGCQGGPGYRGPSKSDGNKGSCVGYANIIAVCGPPPHAKCVRECAIVMPACLGQGRVWLKTLAASFGIVVAFLPSDLPTGEQGGAETTAGTIDSLDAQPSANPKLLPR
jgi:hypothetical protein